MALDMNCLQAGEDRPQGIIPPPQVAEVHTPLFSGGRRCQGLILLGKIVRRYLLVDGCHNVPGRCDFILAVLVRHGPTIGIGGSFVKASQGRGALPKGCHLPVAPPREPGSEGPDQLISYLVVSDVHPEFRSAIGVDDPVHEPN